MDALHSHMGADFFREASKFFVPRKMALGEGILFALQGRGRGGEGGGGQTNFLQEKTDFCENMRKKSKVFSNIRAISSLRKPQKSKIIVF